MEAEEIRAVAEAFTAVPIRAVNRITDGSINVTYEVLLTDGSQFILQRMAPIFSPAVMDNLSAVEPYAAAAGVTIPHAIPTLTGERFVPGDSGGWYRALTYVAGKTIHAGMTAAGAFSASRLVGQFHTALSECDVPLATAISHFHDTHYYLDRMRRVAAQCTDESKRVSLQPIVDTIMHAANDLTVDVRTLPQRVIHADLKVSNIRFDETETAIALIDMDTLMRGSIVTEMGDALRSWCGTAGEDNPEQVFDETICQAALAGYAETAIGITTEELAAIPEGIKILTLELAARFVTDAYEETYFAQSSRYANLFEQNKTKAQNQLSFLAAYEEKRDLLI